jgi:pyruvate/2-oxoglutarate dehydrogenase complex dihydrolipoamide acyltransferase (E2) component
MFPMPKALTMPSYGKAYNVGRFGVVVEWLHREGDQFRAGQPLVVVESDKVTLEVRAPEDGTLVQILAPVGARLTAYQKLGLFAPREEPAPSGTEIHEESGPEAEQAPTRKSES